MGKNHGTKMQMPPSNFSQTLATELRDHRSFAFLTDQLTRILLPEHFAFIYTLIQMHIYPLKLIFGAKIQSSNIFRQMIWELKDHVF